MENSAEKERAMATQNIERRVEKLEEHLSKSDKPETIEEMFRSMERGAYGPVSVASITASILSNGGSGEPLRGKRLPDARRRCGGIYDREIASFF